jgi:hypothetical protein
VGLGILQVRRRAARVDRNPATGEPIQIKASKKVAFRPANELKEVVQKTGFVKSDRASLQPFACGPRNDAFLLYRRLIKSRG